MGGMDTSLPFTQQSATGLLFHLQKASTLLTNLNPQNPSEAYEEKESQVKVVIEDIYNRVVRYDMKGNQGQVEIYEPSSSDDCDYSDEDDDDYADVPLQIPNLSTVQALAAARASAREGYEKRKNGHKNRNRVERKKKRDKRRKRVERKRREKKRLAMMAAGLGCFGKDCAFVFENMQ
ncbi:hypothetical protein HYE67_003149 [Fusarium culmorum]|uniref:Uncharacterized protein n=1 Tax=Fusarium culmorum TaxID=5516 RepID=A0A7S8D320_FUSCU|nr:hypothetical protein HYE67_003149 [Fusarium culmorum]